MTFIDGVGSADFAVALNRVAVGAFFTISGYHKLFNTKRHAALCATLERDNIPYIKVMQWWVPGWEFIAGVTLALGLFSVVSALILGFICLVATCTDGLHRITNEYKPIDLADWLDDLLYLPEVLLGIMLVTVILIGPERYSLDHYFFG